MLVPALVLLLAQGQAARPETPLAPAPDPAAADRAFAARAAEVGVNAAFLEVLGQDAALFQPHPVVGRTWMQIHPDDGQLAWEPRAQVVSRAGDLGVTLGTYTYSREGEVLSAGHYVSVWMRSGEGPWRLLADLGTPHAAPATEVPYSRFALAPRRDGEASAPNLSQQETFLRKVEGDLAEVLAAGRDPGLATVFWADDHTVVLRPGTPPAFGQDPAAAEQRNAWQGGRRIRQGLSRVVLARSGDLAITWGDLAPLVEGAAAGGRSGIEASAGGWLRVWRNDPDEDAWRILAEVVLPPQ
jgi:hypothetical protein